MSSHDLLQAAYRHDLQDIELYWLFHVLLDQYEIPDDAFHILETLLGAGLKLAPSLGQSASFGGIDADIAAPLARVKQTYDSEDDKADPEKAWRDVLISVQLSDGEVDHCPIGRLLVNESNFAAACARMGVKTYLWPKVKWPRGRADLEERKCMDRGAQARDHRQDTRNSSDHGFSVGPANPKKHTRKTRIRKAVEQARNDLVDTLKREPSNEQVIQRLRSEEEATGAIVDYKDGRLTWQDQKGKYHDTSDKTIANLLSKIRKDQGHQ